MSIPMTADAWWAWWCSDSQPTDWYAEIIAKQSFEAGRAAERDSVSASLREFADMLVKVCDDEGGLDSDAAVIGFARAFADKMEAQK